LPGSQQLDRTADAAGRGGALTRHGKKRSLAASQRTGAGITFLDWHQVAFPDDDEDVLMAGVGVIDGQITGVNGYDDDEAYCGY
jgi:hypothetical protein